MEEIESGNESSLKENYSRVKHYPDSCNPELRFIRRKESGTAHNT